MMLLEGPSPGASVEAWKAWQKKLKTMRSANVTVRQELVRAEKMISMLSQPVEPLSSAKLKELFS